MDFASAAEKTKDGGSLAEGQCNSGSLKIPQKEKIPTAVFLAAIAAATAAAIIAAEAAAAAAAAAAPPRTIAKSPRVVES